MVRDFVQEGADCSWTGTTTHDVGANLKEHVVPLEYRDLHGGNNTAACPATKLLYCDQRHTGPHRPRCSTASGRTAAHQGAACCWWWRLVFTSCRANRKHESTQVYHCRWSLRGCKKSPCAPKKRREHLQLASWSSWQVSSSDFKLSRS